MFLKKLFLIAASAALFSACSVMPAGNAASAAPEVAAAAESRRVFVNAVDDPANASAFLSGTIRRDGVTLAISTNGDAPAIFPARIFSSSSALRPPTPELRT